MDRPQSQLAANLGGVYVSSEEKRSFWVEIREENGDEIVRHKCSYKTTTSPNRSVHHHVIMQMSREGCRMRERRRRLMIVMRNAIQVMEVMMPAKGDKYRIRQR